MKSRRLIKILSSLGFLAVDGVLVYASIDALLHPIREAPSGLGALLIAATSAVCILSITKICQIWSD